MRFAVVVCLVLASFGMFAARTPTARPGSEMIAELDDRSGCCSYHGGVCGCSGGRARCCDGTLSPSCGCD